MDRTENTDTIDISQVKFTSTVFPTEEDMKLWHSLTPQEQRAVVMGDIKQGLDGPPALDASKDEIIAEVLDEMQHAL